MLSSPPLYQRRFLPQILPPTVLTFKTPQRHLNNPQLKANDSLPFGYGFFPVVVRYLCSTGSVFNS